jgi:hypothetical protein
VQDSHRRLKLPALWLFFIGIGRLPLNCRNDVLIFPWRRFGVGRTLAGYRGIFAKTRRKD